MQQRILSDRSYNNSLGYNIVLLGLLLLHCFFLAALPVSILDVIYRISYNLIVITTFFCVERSYRGISGSFVLIALVAYWVAYFFNGVILTSVSAIMLSVVFIATVFNLLKQVASEKKVTIITLLQAISGYLLIGLMFSLIINLIIRTDPNAYNFIDAEGGPDSAVIGQSLYYTFISFATVGYGDLLPVSPFARSFAAFMGITGQLYVAIIIAMLIGKYSSK